MYQTLLQLLLQLSGARPELWALSVIALMALTAVALYFFWDLVARAVTLAARIWNPVRNRNPHPRQHRNQSRS